MIFLLTPSFLKLAGSFLFGSAGMLFTWRQFTIAGSISYVDRVSLSKVPNASRPSSVGPRLGAL